MNEETKEQLPAMLPSMPRELSIPQVKAHVAKVLELQREVMKPNIHYGIIPGTPKPTLYKAGAELALLTFMLDPQYEHDIKQDGPHREIVSRCVLYHMPTGNRVASGEGSCSTYESKYAYRSADSLCPTCGKELRRSKQKAEYYCWQKKGGCGATFPLTDERIKAGGRIPNPDLADLYNTVLKMANKRALVAAILNATAASEIFTQDLEDFQDQPIPEDAPVDAPSAVSSQMPDELKGKLKLEPDKKPALTPAQINDIRMGIKEIGRDEVKVVAYYRELAKNPAIQAIEDFGVGEYNNFMMMVERTRKRKQEMESQVGPDEGPEINY